MTEQNMLQERSSMPTPTFSHQTLTARTRNPILGSDFPDPSILPGIHNGYYYAYATQSAMHNLRVARSHNLIDWELLPHGVLTHKPSFAQRSTDFWAPCPVYEDGLYRIYYSLRPDQGDGMGISVAISDNPEGHFIDSRHMPMKQGRGFSVIDPHYLCDPVEQRKWLYYGSHFSPIYVQELREDGLEFLPGSSPKPVVHPLRRSRYKRLLEGFFVIYHPELKKYFGFASGADTWKWYAVSVYEAIHPEGPFVPTKESIVLRQNERWLAPGQCSIFIDGAGDYWLYYHAVDAWDARNQMGTMNIHRVMCASKLDFSPGYPCISKGSPHLEDYDAPALHAPTPDIISHIEL